MCFDYTHFKANFNKKESELRETNATLDSKEAQFLFLRQEFNKALQNVESLKTRIKKIKARKGKLDTGIKMCKNCKKDYKENENYSWKCRTHRSEYSQEDDLWWCCLKKGNDKGCKLQKHESLDDEEDDDIDEDKDSKKEKELKFKRCQCCREIGHNIEDCPRDPNLRTMKDLNEVEKENKRVN